jgi:hypothetical protein
MERVLSPPIAKLARTAADRLATLDGLVAYVDDALRAAPSAGDAA